MKELYDGLKRLTTVYMYVQGVMGVPLRAKQHIKYVGYIMKIAIKN
jgi:hypothetical protein